MVGNNAWMQNIKEWIEQNHPNLVTTGYKITSPDTTDYNCIAKIAIYVLDGKPQHASRQLPNGKWTSKLGQYEDIEHNYLEGLEGSIYGEVSCVMKRRLIERE
ncbi:DUF7689 domain-containing protein [Microcoleus anatoxicus]|uniref:DUF7689 domain-containing protein n=1 Tax=Microcoleus anatoxicus TaxID=2705319 RepID=UPI0030C9FE24